MQEGRKVVQIHAEKPRGEHMKNDVCMYVHMYNI